VVGTVRGKHGLDGTTVFVLGSRSDPPPTSPGYRPVSGTITYTFEDGSTLTALETSIGNVDTATGRGHAGGEVCSAEGQARNVISRTRSSASTSVSATGTPTVCNVARVW
jgi:hypothetical protein